MVEEERTEKGSKLSPDGGGVNNKRSTGAVFHSGGKEDSGGWCGSSSASGLVTLRRFAGGRVERRGGAFPLYSRSEQDEKRSTGRGTDWEILLKTGGQRL